MEVFEQLLLELNWILNAFLCHDILQSLGVPLHALPNVALNDIIVVVVLVGLALSGIWLVTSSHVLARPIVVVLLFLLPLHHELQLLGFQVAVDPAGVGVLGRLQLLLLLLLHLLEIRFDLLDVCEFFADLVD